ncbi:hypothetical protein HYQ45_018228 [Verticillium longisporum]|nr:hypothetical protein HYQ45_018228 [Verticillium longisporum]CRK40792.1 hypothetical protein BN1723_015808 [Verticillium longisporum]
MSTESRPGKAAGKRASRSSLACLPCRSRHLKCDGRRPQCTRCTGTQETCTYAQSRRGGLDRAALAAVAERRKQCAAAQEAAHGPLLSPVYGDDIQSSIPTTLCHDNLSHDHDRLASTVTTSAVAPLDIDCDVAQDRLVSLYYANFHRFHPFVPPQKCLVKLCGDASNMSTWKPLVAALRLVGHIYDAREWSSILETDILSCLSSSSCERPVAVQARLLLSIAKFWYGSVSGGRQQMSEALQCALDMGLDQRAFATAHGQGDPVLEESWRRTWWMLYVLDAYYAGTLGRVDFSLQDAEATVDLPCHESEYESGNIPLPRTVDEFDSREFLPETPPFSSFAYLIGAVRCASLALSRTSSVKPDEVSSLHILEAADSAIDGWLLLLPEDKKRTIDASGNIDELMFQAHLIIHVTTIGLHRPLSDLRFNTVEDISSCAREPARGRASADLINVHTIRVIRAVEAQIRLLALPARPFHHTPFTTCMVSEDTLALLSACKYLLKGKELAVARDQIRMTVGCLKTLGEVWPRTAANVGEIQTIARHVLGLEGRPNAAGDAYNDPSSSRDTSDGGQVSAFENDREGLETCISIAQSLDNGQPAISTSQNTVSEWFSIDELQADFTWWPQES